MPGLGHGRVNVAEGAGAARLSSSHSLSVRLEVPGEDRQHHSCRLQEQHRGCCEGAVRMARSLRPDPRGSHGEQSCLGGAGELVQQGWPVPPVLWPQVSQKSRAAGWVR